MATWPNIDDFLDGRGVPHGQPTVVQTTGGSHAAGSYHYKGQARDYGNVDTPGGDAGCWRVFNEVYPFTQRGVIAELFFKTRGVKNGREIGTISGHMDHCHVALADGKLLPVDAAPPPPPPKPKHVEEEPMLTGR